MNIKALRRPASVGRSTSQPIQSRRWRRDLRLALPVGGAARLTGRWTIGADGRLVRVWLLERPPRFPVNRKRESDA